MNYFLLILIPLVEIEGVFFKINQQPQCVPLSIKECSKIGYNMTRPIDIYSDHSRNIEIGKKYIKIIDATKCSKFALFFLCSVYSPVCFRGFEHEIKPCRNVCLNVKRSCGRYMKLMNVRWPRELDCNGLPEYSSKMCIQPKSFLSRKEDKKSKAKNKRSSKHKCRCDKKHFPKFRYFKKSDYIIKGKVMSRETTANGHTKLFVNVTKVLRKGKVNIENGRTKLWAPTTCLCANIEYDENVYIMGHENPIKRRLLFDRNAFLLPYRSYKAKLAKWTKKCHRKNDCKLTN